MVQHTCDECGSEFAIKYDPDTCDDDPQYCPFCAELLIEFDTVDDDE